MPAGSEAGILQGMYLLSEAKAEKKAPKVQLLGSGAILREVIAAAELLHNDFGVVADVWSCTSFNELRREGLETSAGTCCIRRSHSGSLSWNATSSRIPDLLSRPRLHEVVRDQIRPFVKRTYRVLGTMASAAAIFASNCGASSKSTATMWQSLR
jgi:pyruvate dehydrogenase E1 component